MALCRTYQIPHSHYLGGPNRWTELDRDKAMSYELLLLEQCPKCGTLTEDWVDEDGKLLEEPLMAAVVRHCYGCEEIDKVTEKAPDKAKGLHPVMIPFAFLTDEDDNWFNDSASDARRQDQAKLEQARSMGG